MQIREGVLTMLDTATCGAAATAGMACGALTVASGDPAATAATRRTVASGRNLRMTCSFLVRFRSAAVEGPTTPHIIQGARRLVLRYKGERRAPSERAVPRPASGGPSAAGGRSQFESRDARRTFSPRASSAPDGRSLACWVNRARHH